MLRTPQGIAVDAQGNVWVADTRNNMIRKFSVGAAQIDSLVVTQPSKIAIDKRTGDLLTVEGLTTVSRYLLQTKTLLASFPLNPFTGDASAVFDVGSRSALQIRVEVRALGDLDSSPAGDIFVSAKGSPANCVIRILNGNVSALASSAIDSATTDARFLAVDVFGSVYTSFSFNRGPSSTTLLYAITPSNITQSHSLNEPLVSGDARGATTDGSGVLYITDPATQELVLISTSNERTIRRYLIPDTNGFSVVPRDVTVASDGSVYVVVNDRLGTEAGAVLKYTRTTN
jgi:streptogramin lyase